MPHTYDLDTELLPHHSLEFHVRRRILLEPRTSSSAVRRGAASEDYGHASKHHRGRVTVRPEAQELAPGFDVRALLHAILDSLQLRLEDADRRRLAQGRAFTSSAIDCAGSHCVRSRSMPSTRPVVSLTSSSGGSRG